MSDTIIICGDQEIASDKLDERARRAARALRAVGVGPGDSVAILLPNCIAFMEAMLGAQHLGAYAVPVNWHFATDEVAYVLDDCSAKALVTTHSLLDPIANRLPDAMAVFVVDDEGGPPVEQWDSALSLQSPIEASAAAPVESMIYTSGTTGRPKGVRRVAGSTDQREAMSRMRTHLYGLRNEMRGLLAAPLYHSAPNFFSLAVVRSGGLLLLEQKFDAERTLQLIERHRISHMFVVPTMFVRLLALPDEIRAAYDLSSLENVLHAGAPCAPDIKSRMIDWWGPVIHEYYGSTEAGPLTFCNSAEWLAHRGTVGRPIEGVSLSIRDEHGVPCSPGTPGEICIDRSVQPDFTYHKDVDKRRALEVAGSLGTGDVGYFDKDGYLFICDRRGDMIISGGVNIYPAEIEAVLITLQGIRDCAVIGVPDPEFGEKVAAFVELDEGTAPPSVDDIRRAMKGRIADYKIPRAIAVRARLPRDDSGKIFKRRLRDELPAANNGPGS